MDEISHLFQIISKFVLSIQSETWNVVVPAVGILLGLLSVYYGIYQKKGYQLQRMEAQRSLLREQKEVKSLQIWAADTTFYIEPEDLYGEWTTSRYVTDWSRLKILLVPCEKQRYMKTILSIANTDVVPLSIQSFKCIIGYRFGNFPFFNTKYYYVASSSEFLRLIDRKTRRSISFNPWFDINSGEKLSWELLLDLTSIYRSQGVISWIEFINVYLKSDKDKYYIGIDTERQEYSTEVHWKNLSKAEEQQFRAIFETEQEFLANLLYGGS